MAILGNFVFKPKNFEISKKVIEGFTDSWLNWDDHGIYINYSTDDDDRIPEGYVSLEICQDDGNLQYYTESCYSDEPITGYDLTNHMMVVLDQEGFFDASWVNDNYDKDEAAADERIVGFGTDNPKYYSFEDRELSEVISCLQENNTRSLSFWGTSVYIVEKDNKGQETAKSMPLVDYALNVSLPEKTKKAA